MNSLMKPLLCPLGLHKWVRVSWPPKTVRETHEKLHQGHWHRWETMKQVVDIHCKRCGATKTVHFIGDYPWSY